MSEPVFFYCLRCQMQLSEPHHPDDGRRGMSDDAIREAVTTALADNCIGEPGSDMHSWRCAYPDRYGPCSCLAETVTDVIDAVRPLIEADLRERLAAAIEALEPPDLDGMDRYGAWFEATHEAALVVRNRP